jgi:hypothetical protein
MHFRVEKFDQVQFHRRKSPFFFQLEHKREMADTSVLIQTVNKLQDAFAAVNVSNPIDLPQVSLVTWRTAVIKRGVGIDGRFCCTEAVRT